MQREVGAPHLLTNTGRDVSADISRMGMHSLSASPGAIAATCIYLMTPGGRATPARQAVRHLVERSLCLCVLCTDLVSTELYLMVTL